MVTATGASEEHLSYVDDEPLFRRFLAAQLAGDRAEAVRLVVEEGMNRGIAIPVLHRDVIRRAQLEIGELWQLNRVTVAEEHLATAIAQLALARLYPHLPREASCGKKLVVACVEGELHDMGPRIASDFLEMAGFSVRFLGADVPTASLVALVKKERPDAVVLSITLPIHFAALREAVRAIHAVDPATPIIAGGNAFRWDAALAARLDVAATGADVDELVSAARKVLAA